MEAAQSLFRLTEQLRRNALLGDFAGRAAACDAQLAANASRRSEALGRLAKESEALAASLAADGRAEEGRVLLQVGSQLLFEQASDEALAASDPHGIARRLYRIGEDF